MRALTFSFAFLLWGSCSEKQDPKDWLVKSWDMGVFTLLHAGKEYRLTCEETHYSENGDGKFVGIDGSTYEFKKGDEATIQSKGSPATCESMIELVGKTVPSEGGKVKTDGWTLGIGESSGEVVLTKSLSQDIRGSEVLKIISLRSVRPQ